MNVLENFKLLSARAIPFGFEEIAKAKSDDGAEITVALSLGSDAFYIFTEDPHPDDPSVMSTYVLPFASLLDEMAASAKWHRDLANQQTQEGGDDAES